MERWETETVKESPWNNIAAVDITGKCGDKQVQDGLDDIIENDGWPSLAVLCGDSEIDLSL